MGLLILGLFVGGLVGVFIRGLFSPARGDK